MSNIISDIKGIFYASRVKAYKVVSGEMLKAYWLTGQRIAEEEQGGNKEKCNPPKPSQKG